MPRAPPSGQAWWGIGPHTTTAFPPLPPLPPGPRPAACVWVLGGGLAPFAHSLLSFDHKTLGISSLLLHAARCSPEPPLTWKTQPLILPGGGVLSLARTQGSLPFWPQETSLRALRGEGGPSRGAWSCSDGSWAAVRDPHYAPGPGPVAGRSDSQAPCFLPLPAHPGRGFRC